MSKILVTGGSGFVGSVVVPCLKQMQHEITAIGITANDDINCNLVNSVPELLSDFEWVIHIAGKAHIIPRDENEKQLMYNVNVQGTKNLCLGLENVPSLRAFIFISSVAVYGLDFGENITEDFPLKGVTPYALSKIQAEQYLQEWCTKRKITLGIIRPSLIAGKNPPGNLGAMINGIKSGKYLRIGNGKTKKSVLMAEDIAKVIPKLAEVGGIYNLCDDIHPSFLQLETLISYQLGKKKPVAIPYWIARCAALAGDLAGDRFPLNSLKLEKIVRSLTFSNAKAKRELNWIPMDVLNNFRIN